FRPVPVDQMTQFFAAIGCRPVTDASFDPILHEIITCEAADDPDAPIQVIGQTWPALMIGELVFTRAGAKVRARSAHAAPAVADPPTAHREDWRSQGTPGAGPFCGGPTPHGKTEPRRDSTPSRGHVYDFDALFSSFLSHKRTVLDDGPMQEPLTADQAAFI